MKRIKLSDAIDLLGKDGVQAVPKKGQIVRVCAVDSVSAGGEAINVTETTHSSWRQAAERMATEAGLFSCGFDIICEDISQPMPDPVPVLEMNSMPGLKLLHYPTGGGEPIDAAAMLLDAAFAKPA